MSPEKFGVKPGQHIPGKVVHEYLCALAEEFDLVSHIRLSTKVESAELQDDGDWVLHTRSLEPTTSDDDKSSPSKLVARKLVLATGLTSTPYIPSYPGLKSFTGSFLHSLHLKEGAAAIYSAKEVVVVGANKSAWDTCYTAARAGAHVSMIIRPGGGGPSWVWPKTIGLNFSIQRLATTRLFGLFEPCIFAEGKGGGGFSWLRRFLYGTWIGRVLVRLFWNVLARQVLAANKYHSHPELAKLKPWTSMFWMGNSLGVHNYETDWFQLVRDGRINVYIADVTNLSGKEVILSSGEVVLADTFVSCTGWKTTPPIRFLPLSILGELGLPGSPETLGTQALVAKAREEILTKFPLLKAGPDRHLPLRSGAPTTIPPSSITNEAPSLTPYRLYCFTIPPFPWSLHHRNLAFIGAHLALNAITVAQVQALWITAFFLHEIPNLSPDHLTPPHLTPSSRHHASKLTLHERVEYETILHSEYCRLRHPHAGGGAGEKCPDLVFDGLMYVDLLCGDLGVEMFRKGGGWWREWWRRYLPGDYRGVVEEWMERRRRTGATGKEDRGLNR